MASKALLSVGYDEQTSELELEFRSGRVYRYRDVPRSVFSWLLRTKNKGGFVTRMISGRYPEQALPDASLSESNERHGAPSGPGASPREAEPTPSLEQVLRASLAKLSDP